MKYRTIVADPPWDLMVSEILDLIPADKRTLVVIDSEE